MTRAFRSKAAFGQGGARVLRRAGQAGQLPFGGAAVVGQSACKLASFPQGWADDRARRRKAGVPNEIAFKTRSEIALGQLRFACAAGLPRGVACCTPAMRNKSVLTADIAALSLTYAASSSNVTRPPPNTMRNA